MSPPQSDTAGLRGFRAICRSRPICCGQRCQRRLPGRCGVSAKHVPPTAATTATAGLGVRVDPDWVACPPTRPARHTRPKPRGQYEQVVYPPSRPHPPISQPPSQRPRYVRVGTLRCPDILSRNLFPRQKHSEVWKSQLARATLQRDASKLVQGATAAQPAPTIPAAPPASTISSAPADPAAPSVHASPTSVLSSSSARPVVPPPHFIAFWPR